MRYPTLAAPRASEKHVQAAVVQLYQLTGCIVHSLSQPRATMQTPGLPDLYVQCPKQRTSWWHESKAIGGRLSRAQEEFRFREDKCGRLVIVGGVADAKAQLVRIGLIREPAWSG